MNQQEHGLWKESGGKRISRRSLIRGAAGTVVGAGVLGARAAYADNDRDGDHPEFSNPNPIPGGVAPFAPFGVFIHHFPLNPAVSLPNINDPSQITDFDGFVGLTHIRGGGTGTNTITGATMPLAYQADMGFSQGRFIDTDGHQRKGTFAFV